MKIKQTILAATVALSAAFGLPSCGDDDVMPIYLTDAENNTELTSDNLTIDAFSEGEKFIIQGGKGNYSISVTDKSVITFHYDGEPVEDGATLSVDETSVDLWANTARVTVNDPTEGVQYSVQYREKGTETWHDAAGSVAEGFILAPAYDKSSNEAGLEVSVIRDGAGIYAGNTYEVRLLNSDAEADAVEFTAEGGDVIPNGDMTGWTVKEGTELPYPNPAGTSFWDSGNNTVLTITTILCQEDETEAGVAALSANTVLGSVFAPGNMYTGDFTMSGFTGTAKFGKSYDWTARPRALKLRYKANVGVIDNAGSNDPEKDEWDGRQDVSRIFVAIVDWSAQHEVTSGMTTPEGMWDPAEVSTLEEGAILGYGDLKITGNVESWTDAELKINNLGVKKGESPDNVFSLKIITTPYSNNNDNYQSLILYDVAVTVALTVTD